MPPLRGHSFGIFLRNFSISFVSYRLAETQDAGKTALESGHDQTILFAHYRELVKPQAAKLYWSIIPEEAENIESIGKPKAA